jgi:hypothetical protein
VSFRAHANNDYVSAGNTGASPLVVGATPSTSREKFDLVFD